MSQRTRVRNLMQTVQVRGVEGELVVEFVGENMYPAIAPLDTTPHIITGGNTVYVVDIALPAEDPPKQEFNVFLIVPNYVAMRYPERTDLISPIDVLAVTKDLVCCKRFLRYVTDFGELSV